MRRPASTLPPFASGDGCRGLRQAPRGGAPACILTGMPTTADNRGPGWKRAGCVAMTGIAVRLEGMRGTERNSTRYRATDDDSRPSLHIRQ